MFGEGIIERLPVHSKLHHPENPMRNLLLKSVGAFLDDYDESLTDFFDSCFITEATGKYLDLFGSDYNIPRKLNESDTDYRNRLIYEKMGHLTTDYLKDVYMVKLYTKVEDFNLNDNTLVSDNPHIVKNGFMMLTDETTKNILNKKFVLGEEILWLIL